MIALVISSAVCHSFLPNWFPGNITLQTQPAPHSLPKDFKWGYASAAFQVEGAVNEDKRSPSVWDVFTANSSNIVDGENATTTVDEYHSYTDIIKILKDSGANTYRLSIAWSRLIPSGFAGGRVNRLAVAHYNSVINTLIENRIEPMVTLYHWDLPQVLFEAYGGVTNYERFPDDFAYFAEKSFELFGDRVKYWITFNEPISYCVLGYGEGLHAPGFCDDRTKCEQGNGMKDVLHCGHSTLLAHAQAVDIYRKYFQSIQGGKISIVLNAEWAEPLNKNSAVDKFFAQFKMDYMLGWFADPVYLTGQYPMKMRIGLLRHLPWFTADQSKLIKGSADFLGLNHYTSTFVTHPLASAKDSQGGGKLPWLATYHDNDGKLIGKHAQSSWLYDVPWGLTSLLEYIKNRYNDPDIYITENGFSVKGEANMTLSASLQDDARVRYFNGYLDAMKVAIRKGCKVKGYIAWTLMDNFEWAAGYSERFGVVAVSPDATVRVPKASFYFLKNYFATSMS